MSDTESIPKSAAIKTPASFFKITEVSLWDGVTISLPEDFNCLDFGVEYDISGITTVSSSSIKNEIADHVPFKDLEVAEEMNALGLPISFSTSKQCKNSISIKRKKKVINTADGSFNNDKENTTPKSPRNHIVDGNQPKFLHYKTDTLLNNVNSEIIDKGTTDSQDDKGSLNDVLLVKATEQQIVDDEIDVITSNYVEDNCLESSSLSCLSNGENIYDDARKDIDHCSTSVCCEYDDWRVIWDPYYERNYFYNIQSMESTWYPPQGLESFVANASEADGVINKAEEHTCVSYAYGAMQDIDLCDPFEKEEFDHTSNKSPEETVVCAHSDNRKIVKEAVDVHESLHEPTDHSPDELDAIEYWDKQEEHISEACSMADASPEFPVKNSLSSTVIGRDKSDSSSSPNIGGAILIDELENICEIASKRKKKKKKKRIRRLKSQLSLQEEDDVLPSHIVKYWCQRYSLFSRFDYGIMMDEEGWFSVTPESIAIHHAARCGSGTIVDCFTGVGGNAIQFARKGNHVIAIDIDSMRIDYAEQNATVYGVNDRINFIIGDFFQIAPRLKADVIFLSPPWGGPDYNKVDTYDVNTMLKPCDGQQLFEIARTIASKVVMFLPRNTDINQLAEISLSVNPPWSLEVEKNFLNGRFKAITAYFSKPT